MLRIYPSVIRIINRPVAKISNNSPFIYLKFSTVPAKESSHIAEFYLKFSIILTKF